MIEVFVGILLSVYGLIRFKAIQTNSREVFAIGLCFILLSGYTALLTPASLVPVCWTLGVGFVTTGISLIFLKISNDRFGGWDAGGFFANGCLATIFAYLGLGLMTLAGYSLIIIGIFFP